MIAASVLAILAAAGNALTASAELPVRCRQTAILTLACDYRPRAPGALTATAVAAGGLTLPDRAHTSYPGPGATTAILLLVDTSDPARVAALAANRAHVLQLIEGKLPHHRLGLAAFDTELRILSPIGTADATLSAGALQLRATGQTTELYRNVLLAVRALAASDADRRQLLLMSDGLAEDTAYHHADVVEAARAADVAISSIGYPRSIGRSIGLQTLRRLCDETGGIFVSAPYPGFAVPGEALARAMQAADHGGRVEFDLEPLRAAGLQGSQRLGLNFTAAEQAARIEVAIELPGTPATLAAPGKDARREPVAAATPPPLPAESPAPPHRYAYAAAGLLLLAGGLLAYRAHRRPLPPAPAPPPMLLPQAYLVMEGDPNARFQITNTPWRIGRSRNNDLQLADHSVSRVHAEIRRGDKGALSIHDLSSLNGVFINDRRVPAAELAEGDRVDIGDVSLRFTFRAEDYDLEPETVALRTRMPE